MLGSPRREYALFTVKSYPFRVLRGYLFDEIPRSSNPKQECMVGRIKATCIWATVKFSSLCGSPMFTDQSIGRILSAWVARQIVEVIFPSVAEGNVRARRADLPSRGAGRS